MQKMDKWCPKCQQCFSQDEFYRNAAQSDGLAPCCKRCWRETCSNRDARLREGFPDKRRVQSAVNQRAFTIRYGGKSALHMSEWLHRDLPGLARKRIPTQHYL